MKQNQKLFVFLSGIFIVLIVAVLVSQYQNLNDNRAKLYDQRLEDYNYIINSFVESPKWTQKEIDAFVQMFPDTALRVTIIDPQGEVYYDSDLSDSIMIENHLYRPEIVKSVLSNVGKSIRHSQTTDKDYYYLATRFPDYFIRTALPFRAVTLPELFAQSKDSLIFVLVLYFISLALLYVILRNFSKSLNRLRTFSQKAQKGEELDSDITFPKNELGEIGSDIVEIYKRLTRTKKDLYKEREKLFKHLQISQEGLGIFTREKTEQLVNSLFVQYANIISDRQLNASSDIFSVPEFAEINRFIDSSIFTKRVNRKKITISKGGRTFVVQCIVFQDDSFELSINEVTVQEREDELKRHLTQNISHELKTPVSSIIGYMESILDNPDMEPKKRNFFIERCYQQSKRLNNLLQDISMLNKIADAKHLYQSESCNILQIVDETINDTSAMIHEKNFEIAVNMDKKVTVQGNHSLIYSIFRNLLDNALAYAGENCRVEINCYREDSEFYYFSFLDNGSGVPEEHLNRLFDRFYRVDQGRSRKQGGTGLGLAIVKNAVFYHHGKISAKNVPGGGLCFLFTLSKEEG